jgi:hypothetical protein
MTFDNHISTAGIAMEDDLGITYLIETAAQFWSGMFAELPNIYRL